MDMMIRDGGGPPPDQRGPKHYDGGQWDFDIDLLLDGHRFGGTMSVIDTPIRQAVVDRLRLLAGDIERGMGGPFEDGS